MSTEQVTCPSGLIATVRGMKVRELNILADKGRAVRLETFDDILSACVTSIDDHGHLGSMFINDLGKPDWMKATIADRFTLLVHVRTNSGRLGDEYTFRHKCTECDEIFPCTINVPKDLDFKEFSDEDIDSILNNRPFEGRLGDGRIFTWKTLIGEDERRASKRARKAKNEGNKDGRSGLISVAISERLITFDGQKNRRVILEQIEDLDDTEFENIIEQFDKHDGGYDDNVEVECPECGAFEDHKIPFGGDFWRSSKRKKTLTPSEGGEE